MKTIVPRVTKCPFGQGKTKRGGLIRLRSLHLCVGIPFSSSTRNSFKGIKTSTKGFHKRGLSKNCIAESNVLITVCVLRGFGDDHLRPVVRHFRRKVLITQ